MAACLHRACGAEFSGLTAFDRHLRWHREPPWVSCLPPDQVGLVWSEARQAWATHIGDLRAGGSGGMPPYPDGAMSPDSATCNGRVAS
jgi:hypothetical protein